MRHWLRGPFVLPAALLLSAMPPGPCPGAGMGSEAPAAAELLGADVIEALGAVNGQALACRSFPTSKTAKALMMRYVPKTRAYGALFEAATASAFRAQTANADACPAEMTLGERLAELDAELERVFHAGDGSDPARGEQR